MRFNLNKAQLAPFLLRLGLAIVFAYAAISSLMHPDQWVGYLPSFIARTHDATNILRLFSVMEIGLAVWLLSGKFVRYAALLTTAMLAGIIVAQPGDLIITFRDIGLLFMALALAVGA
jgi:uncharacterized membrane protein YphA (DoxX/SURF4 family)